MSQTHEASSFTISRGKHARYRLKNRPGLAAKEAKRRAGRAAPPWLTQEHEEAILAIYREAIQWEKETGVKHHVDHLIPLQGSNRGEQCVCGLHVPWNLRAIPKSLNRKRGDFFPAGAPPIEDGDASAPAASSGDDFDDIPF